MKHFFKLAYASTVIFLGLIFLTSGMAKVFFEHRFIGVIGPPWLEERLAEFQLGLFARFVAYAQLSIGYLLITYRFRTIGSLMLVPMLANIFMVTVSQNWTGTPYVVAVFLLQNAYLLWYDRQMLLPLVTGVSQVSNTQTARTLRGNLVWLLGYSCLLGSVSLSYWSLYAAWALVPIAIAVGYAAGFVEKSAHKTAESLT